MLRIILQFHTAIQAQSPLRAEFSGGEKQGMPVSQSRQWLSVSARASSKRLDMTPHVQRSEHPEEGLEGKTEEPGNKAGLWGVFLMFIVGMFWRKLKWKGILSETLEQVQVSVAQVCSTEGIPESRT